MKKYVVDKKFLSANPGIAKECKLKVGDVISFDSKEVMSAQGEDNGGGHTNPDDPRKPPIKP